MMVPAICHAWIQQGKSLTSADNLGEIVKLSVNDLIKTGNLTLVQATKEQLKSSRHRFKMASTEHGLTNSPAIPIMGSTSPWRMVVPEAADLK